MKKVSKKIGIESTKLANNSAMPARFSPNTARKRRTTFSAAPLSNMHMPMMAAMPTTMPTSPAVLPNSLAVSSTAATQ
jgi:hypothetical protein